MRNKFMKHCGPKFEMFKQVINNENTVIVEVGAYYGEDLMRFVVTFENTSKMPDNSQQGDLLSLDKRST